jgi:hypothetical protein
MQKNILVGAAIFLCGAVVGIVGAAVSPKLVDTFGMANRDYRAGFEAAQKTFQESELGKLSLVSEETRDFSGTVTAVDGNRITLRDASPPDPFAASTLQDRAALTDETTKFSFLNLRDRCLGTETGLSLTTAALSDIRVGDSVTVIAGEAIRGRGEFPVQEVQIVRKR